MRCSTAHKKLVLRIWHDVFKQDVKVTSRYTSISERALRDWIYESRHAAASRKSAATAVRIVRRRV